MIGAWSVDLSLLFWTFVRGIIVFFILYFLSVALYWYNRTGRIPSFRMIIRMMVQLAKWFPHILVHRVKIVPARVRKKAHHAYPELGIASMPKTKILSKKKSRSRKR
jgi:hypothetical protein